MLNAHRKLRVQDSRVHAAIARSCTPVTDEEPKDRYGLFSKLIGPSSKTNWKKRSMHVDLTLGVDGQAERCRTEEAGPDDGGADGADCHEPPPQSWNAALSPSAGHSGDYYVPAGDKWPDNGMIDWAEETALRAWSRLLICKKKNIESCCDLFAPVRSVSSIRQFASFI